MTLQQHKCKNTVFGIVFFLFFFLGAICGVFLFRCLQRSDSAWLAAYCAALSGAGNLSGGALLLLLLRPVAVVLAVGMFPFGHRLLPLLIFLRGCLMAYSFSACFISGLSPEFVVFRGFILLPLFYFFCRDHMQSVLSADGTIRSSRCLRSLPVTFSTRCEEMHARAAA